VSDKDPDNGPDYRFTLANERTFLAWIRTALGLLAASVAVVQVLPDFGPRAARLAVGLMLAGLALVLAATSHRRWVQVDQAMRTGAPLASPWQPVLTAGTVTVAVVVVIVLMLVD
jgi:putative membrane protein